MSFPNVADSKPKERDLRLLVAPKVNDYHALGVMFDLGFNRIEMFKKEQGGDTVLINMKILTTWIEEETLLPTTWLTLIQALHDMDMEKLARDIANKLGQRPEST